MIIWLVIIGAVVYNLVIKKNRNRQMAQSGEDKELVRQAARPLLATDGSGPLLYAHWEETESYGRRVRTTFFRYVVTYRDQALCVAPLHIDKKTRQMQVGQPAVFKLDNLGKVSLKTKEKNGALEHMHLWLGDKQGHMMLQLSVEAENLRKNKWFPVNIAQQEECEAFERFINSLAQRVEAENPGVDAMIKDENNAGLGTVGAGVSIFGVIMAFFFPPAGIVVTLVGLILAVVSKAKGAKSKVPLIISAVCMLLSLGFGWLYLYVMY